MEMIQPPIWAPGTVKETVAILHIKETRSNRQLATWDAQKEAISLGAGFFYTGGVFARDRKPILLRALDRGRFAVTKEGILFSGPIKRLLNLPWNKLSSIDFELYHNVLEVRDTKSEFYCFCFSGKGLSGKESAVKWYEYVRAALAQR